METPETEGNEIIKQKTSKSLMAFCIICIVMYSVFFIAGIILSIYAPFIGLIGNMFYSAMEGKDSDLNVGLLLYLPLMNNITFYALSLTGIIILFKQKRTGFYIFVFTQIIGVALTIYLMYVFEPFIVLGVLFIMFFTFFAGLACFHLGKYR